MQKAAETDAADDRDDLDLSDELARREDRLKALRGAKAKIAERVKPRDEQAQQDYEDKVARWESKRQAGKKPRSPEPKAPETGPKSDD